MHWFRDHIDLIAVAVLAFAAMGPDPFDRIHTERLTRISRVERVGDRIERVSERIGSRLENASERIGSRLENAFERMTIRTARRTSAALNR